MTMTKKEEKAFAQGVLWAVAEIERQHGESTVAKSVLKASGYMNYSKYHIPPEDTKIIKRVIKWG